jgi:hypothetical protein
MKSSRSIFSILLASSLAIFFISCTKDEVTPALKATIFSNLPADPPTGGYNPTNGQPIGVTKKYTLFSFKSGAVVVNADSASTKWDIGFNGTNIIINSGTSGPGTAVAQIRSGIFDEIIEAPGDGYNQDNKNSAPATYAIPRGSGNGWYSYNQSTNVITPIAGRVLIIRTSENKYAKLEILNYYQDAPATPTSNSKDRYYTFRYLYQPDGTPALK